MGCKFPLRTDPCFDLAPAGSSGGHGSDKHGVTERDPSLGASRPTFDTGDRPQDSGLSRNTIRRYLRGDVVEPAFKVPERPSKLDAFAEKLSAWLKLESGRPRKQRRRIKRLHADLGRPRV